MGIDIHMHTEVKKTVNGIENWVCADFFKRNPYFGEEGEREIKNVPVWKTRDYDLFGVLSGVGNYSELKVISKPRGLPDDCSKEVASESKYWDIDGHSHSWLSLKEMVLHKNEYVGLEKLVDLVIERAKEFWVDAEMEENQEDVRIVFWFDS